MAEETELKYDIPKNYIIDVNHDCNLDCAMCVKRTMQKPFGQKPPEYVKKVIDRLPNAEIISLGALGDPFYYVYLEEICNYFEEKGIRFNATTNGHRLTKDNLDKIPLDSILHVSMDTGHIKTKETFARIKKKVAEAVEYRPDISFSINHLLYDVNKEFTYNLIDFCEEIGVSITFFLPMYFSKELEEKSLASWLDYEDFVKMLGMMCEARDIPYSITPPNGEQRVCIRGLSVPIIAYDGTVYPCDYVYQDIEKHDRWTSWYNGKGYEVPQDNYKMGNIFEQTFEEMWKSDKWRKLRERLTYLNNNRDKTSLSKLKKETDINKDFQHCNICLARWSRCL